MKGKLFAVAVALLLVGTGAAMAAPGNAPDAVPADDQTDDRTQVDGNESDDGHDEANESDDADDAADDVNQSEADVADEGEDAEEVDADEADGAMTERGGPPSESPANDRAESPGADASGPPADDARGPPVEMPAQVPEFVGGVHDAVRDHLNGSLDGVDLGERISSLTPGDSDAADDVGNASDEDSTESDDDGTETPTPADSDQ